MTPTGEVILFFCGACIFLLIFACRREFKKPWPKQEFDDTAPSSGDLNKIFDMESLKDKSVSELE